METQVPQSIKKCYFRSQNIKMPDEGHVKTVQLIKSSCVTLWYVISLWWLIKRSKKWSIEISYLIIECPVIERCRQISHRRRSAGSWTSCSPFRPADVAVICSCSCRGDIAREHQVTELMGEEEDGARRCRCCLSAHSHHTQVCHAMNDGVREKLSIIS